MFHDKSFALHYLSIIIISTNRCPCLVKGEEYEYLYDLRDVADIWDPFYKHQLTLIPAWVGNYLPSKVWNEITYPFQNLNRAHIMMDVIAYAGVKVKLCL